MHDWIGYLLNLNEPEERAAIERVLQNEPGAARKLELARRVLEPLEADREASLPPRDLVARTIGRVAAYICAHEIPAPTDDPTASPIPSRQPRLTPDRWRDILGQLHRREMPASRWQAADFIVVASVLLIGFGIVLSGLPYLRHRATLTACQNQMRQFYGALDGYADRHGGQFPQVLAEPDTVTVASVLRELRLTGDLTGEETAMCPASPQGFASYAYTLGYRDDAGRLRGLTRNVAVVAAEALPLAADRPAIGRTTPNPDHRTGQNVLFLDGHVWFCKTGLVGVGGDDIYRNQFGEVRAGVSLFDSVLGVGGDRP
jgi:prepilin-type processing-associated H-X9-DG protein